MSGCQESPMLEDVPTVKAITSIEKKRASKKAWRENNPDKVRAHKKTSRENNLDKVKARDKAYYEKNRNKVNARNKAWQKNNPDKVRAAAKAWREKNRDKCNEYLKKARSTPKGLLNTRISNGVRDSLVRGKKQGHQWKSMVDFTVEQLQKHLEKKFTKGMSWDLFLKGEIHIDHKIPISAFNFETPDDIDFKKCWSLKNLQPMWAKENLTKNAKLEKPFQPSLTL